MANNKSTSFMKIVIIVIFIQIIDLFLGVYFPVENLANLIVQVFMTVMTLGLLYFMIKGLFKTAKELKESNQKLNNIFESLDVAIWSHDLKSDELLITPGIEKLYGRSLEEFYKDSLLWKKVIHPDDVTVLDERQKALQTGSSCTSVYRITKPDGNVRWIKDSGIPTIDEKGKLVYFSSVLFDITDRKESEEQYRGLVEMSPDIIAVTRGGKFVYMNPAGSEVLDSGDPEKLIGEQVAKVVSEKDILMIRNSVKDFHERKKTDKLVFEIRANRTDGQFIDVEVSAMPILYGGQPAIQLVGRDITDRKKSEQLIMEMAFYDSLTGLPNRNKFKQRVSETMEESSVSSFAILFLDLDRFKVINDTKGHSTGDTLLKEVAKRLRTIVEKDGEVSAGRRRIYHPAGRQ